MNEQSKQHNQEVLNSNFPERLCNTKQTSDITTLGRTTIYERVKNGTFPAPIKLSSAKNCWLYSDLVKWMRDLRKETH